MLYYQPVFKQIMPILGKLCTWFLVHFFLSELLWRILFYLSVSLIPKLAYEQLLWRRFNSYTKMAVLLECFIYPINSRLLVLLVLSFILLISLTMNNYFFQLKTLLTYRTSSLRENRLWACLDGFIKSNFWVI